MHCQTSGNRTGSGPSSAGPDQAESDGLAAGSVVAYLPVVILCMGKKARIRVDGTGMADQRQHRQIVVGIRVCPAMGEIKSVLSGQGAYGIRLGCSVQQLTLKPAGVDTVDVLRRGAQGA